MKLNPTTTLESEVRHRLTPLAGFAPVDDWANVIRQRLRGHAYYIKRTTKEVLLRVI